MCIANVHIPLVTSISVWCGCSLCYLRMQTLGKIYSVLTDKDKRAIYDEDGSIDEESSVFDQVCMDTVGPQGFCPV